MKLNVATHRLLIALIVLVLGVQGIAFGQERNPADIQITTDRVGFPDATKSFSLHLHVAFSQDSGTAVYADAARQGMVDWVMAHPDWAIETRIFTNSVGSLPGLLEDTRVGRGPDCANIVPEYFPIFRDNGYLQPITAYFTDDEMADFFPYIRSTVRLGTDDVYAYWFYTDVRVLYYRTDLVPAAPTTWDEVRDFALAAEAADPTVDGFLFNGGRWAGTWADWISYFWSQGGKLTGENVEPVFNDGENREYMLNVLRFMKELVDTGASPQRVVNSAAYSEFVEAASNKTVAMFMGVDSIYAQLLGALPPEEFAKWAVARLPGRTADQTATLSGGWSFGVLTTDAEKAGMCMDFLKSVYGPKFNAATGLLPPRASTYGEFEIFDTPRYQTFCRRAPVWSASADYTVHACTFRGIPDHGWRCPDRGTGTGSRVG
jgi:multiple sugar transport system substrate-binding protein